MRPVALRAQDSKGVLYRTRCHRTERSIADHGFEVRESGLTPASAAVARAPGPDDVNAALEELRTGLQTFRSTQLAPELFFLGDVLRLNGHPGDAPPYLEEAQAIWRKNPRCNPKDLADLEAALTTTRAAVRWRAALSQRRLA